MALSSYLHEKGDFSKKEDSLEIILQETEDRPRFVQAPDNRKPLDRKPEKEVRFKSDRTQRTELETWKRPQERIPLQSSIGSLGLRGNAKNERNRRRQRKTPSRSRITEKKTGESQNKLSLNRQKQWLYNSDEVSSDENRKPLKLPGFGHSSRPPIPVFVQQRLPPGVRLGNVTALNTDQHRFYSFNQRLISRFLPVWGSRVSEAVYSWVKKNNFPVISQTWVTQVEVIMDKEGEIVGVQPFRLSGLWSVDSAAVESFKKVGNVPNPPEEMVDENGYIYLQFQTRVLYIPQPHLRLQGDQSN